MNDLNKSISEALASNFVLIDLTVRKWSGKSIDRKATEETLALNHASTGAGKFVKETMIGANKELKQCSADFDAIRTYLYANSMPYSSSGGMNKGPRLVSTKSSMEVLRGIQSRINIAESSIQELLDVYSDRRDQAMQNLGTLANSADYPTTDELRTRFGVHIDVLPVPDTGDFSRVSVPVEVAESLGNRMVMQQRAIMEAATTDLRTRLLAEVKRIATQLGRYGDGEKTRLYESLTTNVAGLVDLLDSSNVTSNPAVTELVENIRESLCKHDIKAIKHSPMLATEISEKAKNIEVDINSVEWF